MTRKLFADTALQYKGYRSFRYSDPECGCDESGFDCSGFIVFILRKIQFPLPDTIRHCSEFFDQFGVLVHERYADAGDLIFLSRNGTRPTHIGILISPDEYIHAPGVTDSEVGLATVKHKEIKNEDVNGIRLYHSNPIGFKRLAFPAGRYQKIAE